MPPAVSYTQRWKLHLAHARRAHVRRSRSRAAAFRHSYDGQSRATTSAVAVMGFCSHPFAGQCHHAPPPPSTVDNKHAHPRCSRPSHAAEYVALDSDGDNFASSAEFQLSQRLLQRGFNGPLRAAHVLLVAAMW